MLFQEKSGYCGIASIYNALISLNVPVDSSEIRRVAGTTVKQGTSKRGIVRAIKHYNKHPTIYYTRSEVNAWRWLKKWSALKPIIVLTDDRDHWATVIGRRGHRIILSDPSQPDNLLENNVHALLKKEILTRWKSDGFYAVRVDD